MLRRTILALFVMLGSVFFATHLFAAETTDTLRIAVGFSIQPYILSSGKGILGELISRSLEQSGYRPQFIQNSNREALELFERHEADAVTPVKPGMVDAHYSLPVVVFSNFAFALASSDIRIGRIEELKRFRLGGFSNARRFLGPVFAKIADQAVDYREFDFQGSQLQALYQGEVDIIVSDRRIVEYYRRRLINQAPRDPTWRQPLAPVYEFPENVYHVAFHSEEHRDHFDRSLLELERRGVRHRIIENYRALLERY